MCKEKELVQGELLKSSIEYVECKDCVCWNQEHLHAHSHGVEMGICQRHAPRPQVIAKQFVLYSIKDAEGDDTKFTADEPEKILGCTQPSRVICTTLYSEGCFEGFYKEGLWEQRKLKREEEKGE